MPSQTKNKAVALSPNKLPLYHARDLLALQPKMILKEFPKSIDIQYDDGQIVTSTTRKLVYSWYIWEFHRRYPQLKLTHYFHIDGVLNGQLLSANTHIEMLGRVFKEMVLVHHYSSHPQKEELLALIYDVVNELNNELPKHAGRYVATLDIFDILDVAQDEQILALKDKLEPTANSIEDFYAAARDVILKEPRLRSNNLVQFIRMGILNMNQVNQCILARGFPIEVTGQILKTPITANYVTGMYKLYYYVAESRAAAKHLYSAEAPLQDTEYFARRLQLAGTVVRGITEGDCGSTTYLPWLVKAPVRTPSGRLLYPGDLKFMKGKMYLDEETQSLREIAGNEDHLFGKMIQLRSVLFCQEPDPHMVCATCFGGLRHNVSRYANLGHLCDATLTQQSTQTILSTKHLIGSASGAEIKLKEDAARYLSFSYKTMSYNLRPMSSASKYEIVVNRNAAVGLTDLKLLPNIEVVNAKRISALSQILIRETMDNGREITIPVQIEQNKQEGHFSQEFLSFLRQKGWTTNEYDCFVFDLDGWNCKHPLINMPDVEYSYAEHAKQIADIIESNTKKLARRSQADAAMAILGELFDLVNSKINVSMPLLEVMIYAVMTPSIDDYGMARNKPGAGLHVARFVIQNRSLAPAYAFGHQMATVTNPRSFFQENRPNSPIDVLMTPREVVRHIKDTRVSAKIPYADALASGI